MKKLLFSLFIIQLLSSCSLDEQLCGKVNCRVRQDLETHSVYYLYIGEYNIETEVSEEIYSKYQSGEYICLD